MSEQAETVAIVGSREYPDLAAVHRYVAALPPGTTIVTGGARGVDQAAMKAARAVKLGLLTLYADWQKFGKAAGPMRNTHIVRLSDRVVAFWDGKSRGTVDTMEKANQAGKPLLIITPDGQQPARVPQPVGEGQP